MRHWERSPASDHPEVVELSRVLNALYGERAREGSLFRNSNRVYMKLANFRAVDPLHTSQGKRGLSGGGYGTEEAWTEFSQRPDKLKLIASAIRNASAAGPMLLADNDDDIAEASEGRVLTRLHRTRERHRELVRKKREAVLRETGRLACACGFDFTTTYGAHGTGFIEVHHVSPLHTLQHRSRTRLQDLVVLCANCQRMVHARPRWLTLLQLKELLAERSRVSLREMNPA